MLKNYNNRTSSSGWVKVEDVDGNTLLPDTGKSVTALLNTHDERIKNLDNALGKGANKPNGAITLNADGHINSTADTAFRKINGKSILKTNEDTSDITIDLSLFIVPANNTLPTTGINPNKIYLIKNTGVDASTQNVYTEYMYINNTWEKLGEYKATVDLSDYIKKTEAENIYVKRVVGSPASYILNSSDELPPTINADLAAKEAVSTKLLWNTKAGLSPIDHIHIVTINGKDRTIGVGKVDLGTYLVESEFNVKA